MCLVSISPLLGDQTMNRHCLVLLTIDAVRRSAVVSGHFDHITLPRARDVLNNPEI